jgi:peptide/nickel transport system permease protein
MIMTTRATSIVHGTPTKGKICTALYRENTALPNVLRVDYLTARTRHGLRRWIWADCRLSRIEHLVYYRAMRTYMLKRVLALIPTLIGVTILVFLMMRMIPGTVVDQLIGTEARVDESTKAAMRAFFGLDQPLYMQYWNWVSGLARGDMGNSWRSGLPVGKMIFDRLAVTAELGLLALIISLLVGIPLGTLSAIRENTALDHVARLVSLFSLSMPIFWQAAMLILGLSLWFNWVPPVDYASPLKAPLANLTQMLLPSLVLGTVVAAQVMRMTRSSLLEVLRHDYVRTARAKGLAEGMVIRRHAFKNALIPIITIIGVQIGYLLGGAVVTEEVFTLPGIGRLVLNAVYERDYPLVQGSILFIAVLFMVSNLVVDLLYAYLDPRIRYE